MALDVSRPPSHDHHHRPKHRPSLRHRIHDTIQNIEHVMTSIHMVLGDMGILVRQIDTITEKLENNYHAKLKRPEILLDANRNQYDVIETPGFSNQSKLTLPSPYLDYTFLDLTKGCNVCVENVQSFTYNEKYPLWIQYDTWKTENTVSDLSEVTSGSDSMQSGSDGCSKSWKSISNVGDTFDHYRTPPCFNTSSENKSSELAEYGKCCKSRRAASPERYCGVYERLMEQQLEGITPEWHEATEVGIEDSFTDDDDSSASRSSDRVSLSDEHVIHYNKASSSWTAYKMADVTVRECSDNDSNSAGSE